MRGDFQTLNYIIEVRIKAYGFTNTESVLPKILSIFRIKMHFRFYILFLLLISGLTISSCKKKENPGPEISFTSPVSGNTFYPGDTIHVVADISDDNELPSVTLKLLDAAYMPVDHQESFAINAASFHLSYNYVIENEYLETGNYYLTLSTSDGDNNRNEFRSIFIYEIPKTKKTTYVLTAPDSTHVNVSQLDSGSNLAFRFSVTGDYAASVINSRYKQLSIAGKTYGGYNLFNLEDGTNLFSEPAYNNTLPSFQNLFFAHYFTFMSYYDGHIRAFDKEGTVQFNSVQPVYYRPDALCVNDQYVFAEGYYPGAAENRLVVIYYSTGEAKQEYNIDLDITSMVSKDNNNIIVFGNKNGDGKIILYSVTSNGISDFHTLFGNTIYSAIAIDDDRYALATAGGLYSYQESNNNLIPIDNSEPAYSLEYDDVNGILYANAGRRIKEYIFPDPGVVGTVISVDSVLDVRILYSK